MTIRSLLAAAALLAATSANAQLTNPKHFMWGMGQSPSSAQLQNDLIYHGGNAGPGAIGVETSPAVYLVFWGPQWASGFTIKDTDGRIYTSNQLKSYVTHFFRSVGGSPWAGVQTQYCKNVPAGTVSCAHLYGATFIRNPSYQLDGTWTDSSAVPSDIIASGLAQNLTDDPIAAEAKKAAHHFGSSNHNATYFILTPPSTVATGQPVYCGYHTQTTSLDGRIIQYAFIPYLNEDWPGVGQTGCGMHSVNAKSDSFGHGIFDGYSIVTGHEYSEAVTDPDNFASDQDGWNDAQGSENGDKCAWYKLRNVTMGSYWFPVQPTWSNEAFDRGLDGCQVVYPGR